jgi:hypothetical protein
LSITKFSLQNLIHDKIYVRSTQIGKKDIISKIEKYLKIVEKSYNETNRTNFILPILIVII